MNKFKYFLILASILAFSACKKDSLTDDDSVAAQDNSIAETEVSKTFEAIDRSLTQGSNKTSKNDFLPNCADVSIDSVSSPRRVVIDFGTSGCVCSAWDGKTRKGKIIATWTGRYIESGTIITFSTENYFVDNNQHKINKVVKNLGKNNAGNPTWEISADNSVVTPDGTISWKSVRIREWTKGWDTKIIGIDDEYSITTPTPTTGVSRKGDAYSAMVTKPLQWRAACPHRITAGTIDLTIGSKPKRIIDYGNGGCDKTFTVTIEGRTYTFNK